MTFNLTRALETLTDLETKMVASHGMHVCIWKLCLIDGDLA